MTTFTTSIALKATASWVIATRGVSHAKPQATEV